MTVLFEILELSMYDPIFDEGLYQIPHCGELVLCGGCIEELLMVRCVLLVSVDFITGEDLELRGAVGG